MIVTMAGFDYLKYDEVKNNLDIVEYVHYQCMKKYNSFIERLANKRAQ